MPLGTALRSATKMVKKTAALNTIPGGWYRPETNVVAAFKKRMGRDPDEGELGRLRYIVKYAKQAFNQPINETTLEAGHGMLAYYLRDPSKGLPPKKYFDSVIGPRAQAIVQQHIHAYHEAHKGGMFGWVSNVVKTAGAALHSVTKGISDVTGAITKAVGKIPIVGGPLKAAFDVALVGPFRVTDGIITGKRIDKVVFNELKAGVNAVKEVAPYVQTVASLVPGVGTGISGALGAGLAIADGRPITEALEAGIKGAIPGGVVGQSLYSVTSGVMSGKGIDEIAMNALPIPDESKKALATALEVTKRVAKGERIDKIVIDKAKAEIDSVATKLGGEAAKSLKIGIAVGHAKELQSIMAQQAKSAPVLKTLVSEAKDHIKVDPVLADAMKIVPKGKAGFMVGAALMKKQVTPVEFLAIRNRMKGENRKAFDLASSIHVGRVTHKEPAKFKNNPGARAGFYATLGMRGAKMSQKVALLKAVDAHPHARQGSKNALQLVKHARLSYWGRIKYYLGIHGEDDFGIVRVPPKKPPPHKVAPPPKHHINPLRELPGHAERRIIHHSH